MGEPQPPLPAYPLLAAFSQYQEALDWSLGRAIAAWGEPALASPAFRFNDTEYYTLSMGAPLVKRFWLFQRAIDPADIVRLKLESGDWERECGASGGYDVGRPLNLDPGYMTTAKLVLASTKDHAHRIYIGQGIYGEVTLHYQTGAWRDHDWTFPDYRRADYQAFFTEARLWIRERGREERRR